MGILKVSAMMACHLALVLSAISVTPFVMHAAAQSDSGDTVSQANDDNAVAQFESFGSFRAYMMTAEDAAGTYYSVGAKLTFTMESDGTLELAQGDDEPTITAQTDESTDFECMEHGGGYNQRTAWFPYTAIFVRGGALERVRSAEGGVRKLRALSKEEDGSAKYLGEFPRPVEYSFVPCVGKHRVDPGLRLDSYLDGKDRLLLRMANGKQMNLRLPQPFVPFLLARYRSGAMIPVPVRIVVASIDLLDRRVVLQLQSTVAMSPLVRKLELRAVMKDTEPADDETAARFRERTRAVIDDLARCGRPVDQAIEPCADPTRKPDMRIFLPGGKSPTND